MRLGKIEKAILAYLGNLDESTNFESTREDIRKGIGYDPDETALNNAKKMVEENPKLILSLTSRGVLQAVLSVMGASTPS